MSLRQHSRFVRPITRVRALLLATAALAAACGSPEVVHRGSLPPVDGRLFTRLPSSYTGVRFENRVVESPELNVFVYRNFYNGGGVAIGDLTGDGLPEVVLTANQGGPRLYLNEGKFQFRDVTAKSGLKSAADAWTTGVTFADVNGDGRLDIYVSKAGPGAPARRANELWINEGAGSDSVPHFTERAKEYGVADEGWSTQAAFFDYDRDGDLDLLVINNSPRPVTGFGIFYARMTPDKYGGAKLYRNDGGRFTEVTERAGIFSPENAFGLGIAVGDVNRDGWPDVYISNDFFERDYLYVNKGDGTFDEQLDKAMPVLSQFSMGLDIADVDNDGWPDVYTTDMLPSDEHRLRTTSAFDGWDIYQSKVRHGYHHQLMRDMLQQNNGDGTFSDVGQMAGVARTDWSWTALIEDLDLDGRKDIFVTNGLARDATSQDFIAFQANEQARMPARPTGGPRPGTDYMALTKAMPQTPIPNAVFHNEGGLSFTEQAAAWGLDTPSFSNGAAYGDLDGDGAPDLVVNNTDGEAFVYRNNARTLHKENHFLQVRLDGEGQNRFGVGARVTLRVGGEQLVQEAFATRGFQSSVDPVLTFGLGPHAVVDTLTVEWPDGRVSTLAGAAADRRLTMRHADARAGERTPARTPARPLATPPRAPVLVAEADTLALPFRHRENEFVDFDRERLMPRLLSTEGPALAVGDVDGDGLDDVYLGGAKDRAGRLLLQRPDGRFVPSDSALFEADAASEDVGALFFDANGDGKPDLYVVSGGSDFPEGAPALQDRLYLNVGHGKFRKAPPDALPPETNAGSHVVAIDYDGDGDLDLFVGGRVVPGHYGEAPRSMLLQNDGTGHFTDVTERLAPQLAHVGMVTDAVWQDVDRDGKPDLVVVGEWMPITVFRNAGGGRLAPLAVPGLANTEGWWNRIVAGDFDGDGRVDFVVGNLGLNTRLQATDAQPVTMYVADFDKNGFAEQVVTYWHQGKRWPLPLRDDLIRAIPPLKARYLTYEKYASATVDSIFTPAELSTALVRTARTFASVLVHNDGDGRFTLVPLPREAQVSTVYGIAAADVDGDGKTDLLLGGNFDGFKPEIGRAAASYGLLLRGDGAGHFTPVRASESGFMAPGQVRDIARLRTRSGAAYVVARNDDQPLLFRAAPHAAHAQVATAPRAPTAPAGTGRN
ncbi:ASPIC/UnbV domain protein [Gemmatirosa kalamazoonensis]|uniref:ASPIC/UnbV domain protein n=1 Tax=Gemmatirosa kalamazoonensis TaxID=861299 RepID=W0RFD3_9BACT|nr:VCBS repeat-containing protein [Gemmatirosa kalamazoonensis]AHG89789.1 ASPIC/UnbV domain protein [Gemmatirosa kalamazoonensis]